jgi:hypothetical protein
MEALMKKVRVIVLALGVSMSLVPTSQAASKIFKNCTELNKVYPGGVALPGAVNKGGTTKLTPKYDKNLYKANKKSDRDKDGIACEK